MIGIGLLVCVILIALDQISKWIALSSLSPVGSGSIPFIDGFMEFTLVFNKGASFGILAGHRWLFVSLTIVVSIGIIIAYIKMPKTKEYNLVRISLMLILSGAFGNIIDRIRMPQGVVIDFLNFMFIDFPVFNFADIYVVSGSILLAVLVLFVLKEEPKEKQVKSEEIVIESTGKEEDKK